MNKPRSRSLLALIVPLALASSGCAWRGPVLSGPYGIVGLIHLAVQIWAIVEIVQSRKSTLHKVLWVLFVLFFPFIGIICWFLLGRE